ncbi:MAG: hypothetical protein FD126_1186 [Elusimicrobia bacterium]|nr:MAG: hypothetical protein FD126_1186 [Elusimicrobiota bacterium]
MTKFLMAAVLASVSTAQAAPSVNFDKGLDAKAFLSQAKKEAKADKTDLKGAGLKYRTERDCARFTFSPDGPTTSEAVWLRSTEYYEECYNTGDPRNGGGRYCHEVPRYTHRERVQLELRNRQKLFPWEKETFEVCLDGSWLNLYSIRTAHEYKANRSGGDYVLNAGARKAMDPDSNGIEASAPAAQDKAVAVAFKDRWASYYAGEKVKIKASLKREVEGWFDPTLKEVEVVFDAAETYTLDFNAYAKDFSEALKPGKKYYVEWGFSRHGKVSKDTYMKVGDGPTAVYQPTLMEVASLY